jgi:hypothetical protein
VTRHSEEPVDEGGRRPQHDAGAGRDDALSDHQQRAETRRVDEGHLVEAQVDGRDGGIVDDDARLEHRCGRGVDLADHGDDQAIVGALGIDGEVGRFGAHRLRW